MHARIVSGAVAMLLLFGCPGSNNSGGKSGPVTGSGGSGTSQGSCIQNQACVRGAHWDNKRCACVTGGETGIDGGTASCVDTQLCVRGKHWDATTCRCESESDADAGEPI